MNDLERLYTIPPKPVIYKGVRMRTVLEMETARALDRIGIKWTHEPVTYADETGRYLPDFLAVDEIQVLGAKDRQETRLYIEARHVDAAPSRRQTLQKKKVELNAGTLLVSEPEALLLFVGMEEFDTALLGWCYGLRREDWVLGVIGVLRDPHTQHANPCLFVDQVAQVWVDGYQSQVA